MTLQNYRQEVLEEFYAIMEFWSTHAPTPKKSLGFHASITNHNKTVSGPKSTVATARILWGFSHAIRFVKSHPELISKPQLLHKWDKIARRAARTLIFQHWDPKYEGFYWNVDNIGKPLNTKKQMYAHSFAIYALSEASKVLNLEDLLLSQWAEKTFDLVIQHARDKAFGGYIEAFEQGWSLTDEYILSSGEDRKSMNTHLHLIECFANLYSILPKEKIKVELHHSIEIMLGKIMNSSKTRMQLFFTEKWQPTSQSISYGHDIEASWLLLEAAEILGNHDLEEKCKEQALRMAKASIDGLTENGGMVYEYDPSNDHTNGDYSWWVIAECMVGYLNAYQLSGKQHFLQKSQAAWAFAKENLIDHKNGEWFSGVNKHLELNTSTKANPWKAPYHNLRACTEVYKRLATS